VLLCTIMSTMLRLFCYVLGDYPSRVFPVNIDSSETIGDLKDAIKAKKSPIFNDVSADMLDLFKVSIAADDMFKNGTDGNKFEDTRSLRPTSKLSRVFPEPLLDDHIHVVVKPPPDLSAHGLDERSIKRRKLDVNTPAYSPSMRSSTYWSDFHMRFWGRPIDPKFKTLPTENPPESDSDAEPLGEILLDEPFLDVHLPKQLLVRAEYIRVFNYVQVIHAEESSNERLAVITGHPGIGKTSWIWYALRRCLGEEQSVVLYDSNRCYFFSKLGVTIIDPLEHKSGDKHTWCFVDSTSAPDTLDTSICSRIGQLYPIYITSPKASRWYKLHQQRIPNVIVMNPWTIDEMLKARVLYPDRGHDEVIERFGNAGPSARLCLPFTSADLKIFYANRRETINTITVPEFERLIWDGKGLMVHDASNITAVRRKNPDEMETHIVQPVSEQVRCQLRSRLQEWAEMERIWLLKRLSRIPGARSMLGVLFEAHFQEHFAKEIKLDA